MKLIYIAGPYRPYTCADGTWVGTPMNIRNAEVTAVHLVDELGHLGLFPVVPHLNTRDFENQVKENHDQYFLDGTMALLERCDAISIGTKAEVHRAYQLGIQVYRSFDALRRAAEAGQIVRLPIPQTLPDRTGLQGMYELLRRNKEDARRFFMQMSPGVGKARDTDGPLTVYDFAKLEDRVMAGMSRYPVVLSYGQSISIQLQDPPFAITEGVDEMEVELLDGSGMAKRVIARRGADGRTWTAECGTLNYQWTMLGEYDPPGE